MSVKFGEGPAVDEIMREEGVVSGRGGVREGMREGRREGGEEGQRT